MNVGTVQAWIEQVRPILEAEEEYPLIDSLPRVLEQTGQLEEMEDEIRQDADLEHCRSVLESEMARDPTDIAARFVALSFFYELLADARPMDEDKIFLFEKLGKPTPALIERHLGELIRLVDVEACQNPKLVRWEIVNACAVADWDRAARLHDRLVELVPEPESQAVKGQFLFQVVFMRYLLEPRGRLEDWQPVVLELDPSPPTSLRKWLSKPLRYRKQFSHLLVDYPDEDEEDGEESLVPEDSDRILDAIAALDKALRQKPELHPSYRLMLARCHFAIGNFDRAAERYRAFMSILPNWPTAGRQGVTKSALLQSTALAQEGAGRIEEAIATLEQLAAEEPQDDEACERTAEVYGRMAGLEAKRARYDRAYELLRKQVELNPSLDRGPLSVLLAMQEIQGDVRSWLAKIGQQAPQAETGLLNGVVSQYWPAFAALSKAGQQEWITGLWLLHHRGPEGRYRGAVVAFAAVLEDELRARLFEPFARQARERGGGWEALPERGRPFGEFRQYLHRGRKLGLGEMFDILGALNGPGMDEYRHWLHSEYPGLLNSLRQVPTFKISAVRNRVHKIGEIVSRQDAEEVADLCRRAIDILLGAEDLGK
jgi:tetratricopeptide (TPR) repeat protein